ncbi:MAG: dipeptide epimerase [Chitinophagaceae bacterium]|nr:dipeptide epimerase [Chitinophagaceae bacterium]
MKLAYWSFDMEFEHPFTISKGTKTHQPTLIVELSIGSYSGYGEAPAINYYNITVEQMIADLLLKKPFIEKFALTDPERYWHYLHHLLPQNPFLVCALDMAAWDLWGKIKKLPIYKLWNTSLDGPLPITDFTIGIDSIDKMVSKLKEKQWPIYKIKLGTPDDISIMETLRQHTNAIFRVDANAAWTIEEALQKIPQLAALGVEFVEQPLDKSNWEGMQILYQHSQLPLIADESCVFEQDVKKCLHHFHGINIKLTKCGGLTPARRMITEAKELGLKVMMGCMNESSIGAAAICQFLPQLDYVDVDGPLLLKSDLATGLQYDHGKIRPNNAAGLGVNVNFAR